MNTKEFETWLSKYARSASDIDQRVRPLREAGKLPTTRGRHSPDISSLQAAIMVLTLVAKRANEGAETALSLLELMSVPSPQAGLGEKMDLLTFVGMVIDKLGQTKRYKLARIEIREDGAAARSIIVIDDVSFSMIFSNSRSVRKKAELEPENYQNLINTGCDKWLILNSEFLEDVAVAISDREEN